MQYLYLNARVHHCTFPHGQWAAKRLQWRRATVLILQSLFFTQRVKDCVYLGRKVVAELEILEEGRHDDGGEEEEDAPEEDIGDVGPFGAAGAADELATLFNAILRHRHVSNEARD